MMRSLCKKNNKKLSLTGGLKSFFVKTGQNNPHAKITRFNATYLTCLAPICYNSATPTYLPEAVVLPNFGVLFLLLSHLLIELRLLFLLLELLFSLLLLLLPPLVLLLSPRLLTDVSLTVEHTE
jgi:hypothetical protein